MNDKPDRRNEEAPSGRLPESPECPFCGERRTELLNVFGPHASVSSYWCRACRSPFDFLKWGGREDDPRDEGPDLRS